VLAQQDGIHLPTAQIQESEGSAWPVCSHRGVIGVIRRAKIEADAQSEAGKTLEEIIEKEDFPHLHLDHSLHAALDRMGGSEPGTSFGGEPREPT
jgi:hypothetical protein